MQCDGFQCFHMGNQELRKRIRGVAYPKIPVKEFISSPSPLPWNVDNIRLHRLLGVDLTRGPGVRPELQT